MLPTRNYKAIIVSQDSAAPGVATITLNRPERRNAIGPQMINELLYVLDDAANDTDTRVLVLTGAGKAFCGGGDMSAMTSGGDGDELAPRGDYADLLLAMTRSVRPIVAKVNGHAMGGGLGLVAASTFAIASAEAQLGTPEVDVGLFPMMIMAVLARVMPQRRLIEMMLLGERISADEAARVGLLNRAVPATELDAAVASVTSKLLEKSPLTIKLGLEAFSAQTDLALQDALPLLRERLAGCLATNDAREGLMAFLEKRKPNWTGT
ncbi:MAG: enoyl-CoA hydratase-related protein [Polyangiaceae bacterium]